MKVALRSDTLVLSNAEASCGVITFFRPLFLLSDQTEHVETLLVSVYSSTSSSADELADDSSSTTLALCLLCSSSIRSCRERVYCFLCFPKLWPLLTPQQQTIPVYFF